MIKKRSAFYFPYLSIEGYIAFFLKLSIVRPQQHVCTVGFVRDAFSYCNLCFDLHLLMCGISDIWTESSSLIKETFMNSGISVLLSYFIHTPHDILLKKSYFLLTDLRMACYSNMLCLENCYVTLTVMNWTFPITLLTICSKS